MTTTAIHPVTGKEFRTGSTQQWFAECIPNVTAKALHVQLGVHYEEVAESLAALAMKGGDDLLVKTLAKSLSAFAGKLKRGETEIDDVNTNWREFGDGLADTRVTSLGSLHVIGANVDAIVKDVDDSNFSKFVDGHPIYDENGKVDKGPDFFRPDVKQYIPEFPPAFDIKD